MKNDNTTNFKTLNKRITSQITFILLFIICTTNVSLVFGNSNTGPTFSWSDDYSIMAVDAIYYGQKEQTLVVDSYINDSDGIDTVILRLLWEPEDEWVNISATQSEGNSIWGYWNTTLKWQVDRMTGWFFEVKMWANDTLGNWSETAVMGIEFVYFLISTRTSSTTSISITSISSTTSANTHWFSPLMMLFSLFIILRERRKQHK